MNRFPDGTKLTAADMERIGRDNGVLDDHKMSQIMALHSTNLIMSALTTATAELRFALMMRGELLLDTRTAKNSKEF